MEITFPNRPLLHPNLIAEVYQPNQFRDFSIREFPIFSPAYATITKQEKEDIIDLLRKLQKISGLNYMPPRVRVDFVCADNKLTALEVNADIPAGFGLLIQCLQAYGEKQEYERLVEITKQIFREKESVFILDDNNSFIDPTDVFVFNKILGAIAVLSVQKHSMDFFKENGFKIFRMAGRCCSQQLKGLPKSSLNPIDSGKMGEKALLALVKNNPLVPESEILELAPKHLPYTVPRGFVAKQNISLAGTHVFFSGDQVTKSGLYLLQKHVDMMSHVFNGQKLYFGIDIFVLDVGSKKPELCAYGRTRTETEKLLNVNKGGSYLPMVLKVS